MISKDFNSYIDANLESVSNNCGAAGPSAYVWWAESGSLEQSPDWSLSTTRRKVNSQTFNILFCKISMRRVSPHKIDKKNTLGIECLLAGSRKVFNNWWLNCLTILDYYRVLLSIISLPVCSSQEIEKNMHSI